MKESPPITSTSDSVDRFASDLRKLRLAAGSPTYKQLHSRTRISRSVLSEAFAGRQLPSPRTLEAIVRACNGEADPWLDRRDALAEQEKNASPLTGSIRGGAVSRKAAILLTSSAFVVGATASAVATGFIVGGHPSPTPSSASQTAPRTGDDPAATTCLDDAVVATSSEGPQNSLLEIIWSNECQAGWGRITRYDGLADGNTVTVAIYPEPSPHGPDRQEATEHDVQGAYTNLVVRPTPDTLLCAEGSFTVDGASFALGEPLCL